MVSIGYGLKWIDYHLVLRAGGRLPPSWAYALARLGAAYRYHVRHQAREAARRHLREFLPGSSEPELEKRVKEFFISPCLDEQETYFQPRLTLSRLNRLVELEGVDQIRKCLDRGRGAIVFSAHNSSVCLFAVAHGLLGFKTSAIVRPIDLVDDPLHPVIRTYAFKRQQWMEKILARPYLAPGPKDLRRVIQRLRANEIILALLDVPPELSRKKVTVEFLGKSCLFPAGIARLAEETGCGLIFCRKYYYAGWSRLRLIWEEPIYASGDFEKDIQRCISRMEDMIRQWPSQWYWWDSLPRLWAPPEGDHVPD